MELNTKTTVRIHVLGDEILSCKNCSLCETRRNVVLARGHYNRLIFIVGEAPGEQEDIEATPFVGDSGVMLETVFSVALGISTQDCYVTNLVKCRPPNNKLDTKEWQNLCYSYLYREVSLLQPKVIVTLGDKPTKALLGNAGTITSLNATVHYCKLPHPDNAFTRKQSEKTFSQTSYFIVPIFHPSALIRSNTLEHGSYKDKVARGLYKLKDLILNPDDHVKNYLIDDNDTFKDAPV